MNNSGKFASCQYCINIGNAVVEHLRPLGLEFFGGARHNGDTENLLSVNAFLLREICFYYGTHHLLRTFACRDIFNEIRIKFFNEFHPARRTACKQRQFAAIFNSVDKLGGLFHYCKVGGKRCIEYAFKTKLPQSGCHKTANIGAGF